MYEVRRNEAREDGTQAGRAHVARRGWVLAFVASAAVHALIGASAPRVRATLGVPAASVDIEITEVAWRSAPAPEPARSVAVESVGVTALPERAPPEVAEPSRPRRAAPTRASTPARVAPDVAPPAVAPAPVAPAPVRLDPRRVAGAYLAQQSPTATESELPRARAEAPAGVAATSASVAASLRPAPPPPAEKPRLTRGRDGSHMFAGNGFDAVIRKDGSVQMRDKFGGFSPPLVPMRLLDGGWAIGLGGATFDLTALLEHAFGNDPYRSERRWFLSETRALREQLAERADEQALLRRLKRIWTNGALSLTARRERLFAAWAECEGDAPGRRGREIVEAFVRENCPEHDPRGFSGAELIALNRERHVSPPFAPYRE